MSIGSAPVCDGVTNVDIVGVPALHGVYTGSGRASPGAPLNERDWGIGEGVLFMKESCGERAGVGGL